MSISVHAPDGSIVQFPDGTQPGAIQKAMAAHFGAPDPAMARALGDARSGYKDEAPALVSFQNAFSLGQMPRLAGALAAIGLPINNLLAKIPGMKLEGKPVQPMPYSMWQAYQANKQAAQEALDRGQADDPGGALAGSLVGAVVSPGAALGGKFIAGAKTLPQMALRGGAVGGAIGGSMNGPTGIVPGAVTGAALPVAGAAVGGVARRGVNAGGAIVQRARAALSHVDPEAPATSQDTVTAAQKVAQLIRTSGKTIDQLPQHPAAQAGLPVTTAEAIGRPGVSNLGALGRRAGTTPDALQATLADRAQGTPSRIHAAFAGASGIHPEAASGDIDALVQRLQKDAGPLYKAALSSPDPVWSPDLANLAQRPVIKKAIGSVANDELNAGRNPMAIGLKLDPDTGWTVAGGEIDPKTGGVTVTPDVAQTTELQPTARTWDLVKKAIGRQVERHPFTGRPLPDSQSQGNFGVRVASQDLTNILAGDPANGTPGAIPGYRAALDKAGDYLRLNDAFDKGAHLLTNPNINESDFADVYKGLGDAEQQAFKGGFANQLYDLAQNGRLTPRTFLAPRVQQKVTTILGPDAASDFLSNVGMERNLAATGSRMAPGQGSPTMELGQAGAEQDHGADALGMLGGLMHNPLKLLKSLPQVGADAPTTPQVRNEMGRMLMQHPQQTADELQTILAGLPQRAPPQPMSALAGYATPTIATTLGSIDQPGR